MADLESIAKKEEVFNPFVKKDYEVSKYEGLKENVKNFLGKPSQYLNKKLSSVLKQIFFPYL